MIKGRKVYDPLTNTWSTGYWVVDDKGNYYPVWQKGTKMERLTEKNSVGSYFYPKCFEKCEGLGASSKCDNCEIVTSICEKLGKYEDLEEHGRLIKLPCEVGDTVYVPTRDFISELRIVHISISKNNTFFHWMLNTGIYPNLDGFSVDKIGKTVFLTQSAAEEKLKELRCNND